jgi:hypothetical protein
VSYWRGYKERSTQRCRSTREPIERLDNTVDNREPAAEPVYVTIVDLES